MGTQQHVCVVIESPYSGDLQRNVEYALRAMQDCLKRGEAPFASHLLYTQVPKVGYVHDDNPTHVLVGRIGGISAGLAWAARADKTVVYADYGISQGMQMGIDHATSLLREVEFRLIGANPQ